MTDSKDNQEDEKRAFQLFAHLDVLAKRNPDLHNAANSGKAEKHEFEQTRTNKHSGSAGGDQMQSIELVFEDGSKISRLQPRKETDAVGSQELLYSNELARQEVEKRIEAMAAGRNKLLTAAIDAGDDVDKIAALGIKEDDIGSALTVYLLGVDRASALGSPIMKSFGDQIIIFGIAPAYGVFESGTRKLHLEQEKLMQRGAANVMIGSVIGYAIERAHPVVGAGALALGVGTFGDQLLTSKEAKERNAQLKIIADKAASGLTAPDLVKFANHTKQSLGPVIFDGTFDVLTSGISLSGSRKTLANPHDQTVKELISDSASNKHSSSQSPFQWGFAEPTAEVVEKCLSRLSQLPAEVWCSLCSIVSDLHRISKLPDLSNLGLSLAYDEIGSHAGLELGVKASLTDGFLSESDKRTFKDFVSFMSSFQEKFGRREREQFSTVLRLAEAFEKTKIGEGKSGEVPTVVLASLPDRNSIPAEILEKYSVVQQKHKNACVAAVGEMITGGTKSQDYFLSEFQLYRPAEQRKADMPADFSWLKKELGQNYICESVDPTVLSEVRNFVKGKKCWAAELKCTGSNGHAVLVQEQKSNGNLHIRDPLKGSFYEMTVDDFSKYWTGRNIIKRTSD